MDNVENVTNLRKTVNRAIRAAIDSIDLEAHLFEVEDEDGQIYYKLQPKSKLTSKHLMIVDDALIAAAKMYSEAGVANTNRFYRKTARMVHYALSDIDARAAMQLKIEEI